MMVGNLERMDVSRLMLVHCYLCYFSPIRQVEFAMQSWISQKTILLLESPRLTGDPSLLHKSTSDLISSKVSQEARCASGAKMCSRCRVFSSSILVRGPRLGGTHAVDFFRDESSYLLQASEYSK